MEGNIIGEMIVQEGEVCEGVKSDGGGHGQTWRLVPLVRWSLRKVGSFGSEEQWKWTFPDEGVGAAGGLIVRERSVRVEMRSGAGGRA